MTITGEVTPMIVAYNVIKSLFEVSILTVNLKSRVQKMIMYNSSLITEEGLEHG